MLRMAFLVTITKIPMLNAKFSVTISNQLENVKKKRDSVIVSVVRMNNSRSVSCSIMQGTRAIIHTKVMARSILRKILPSC